MRLSNVWDKFREAALSVLAVAVVVLCIHQFYSAVADGTVMCMGCRSGEWITFQARPGFYVVSLVIYLIPCVLLLATFFAWLFPRRDHWRSRQLVDDAIRQTPQER